MKIDTDKLRHLAAVQRANADVMVRIMDAFERIDVDDPVYELDETTGTPIATGDDHYRNRRAIVHVKMTRDDIPVITRDELHKYGVYDDDMTGPFEVILFFLDRYTRGVWEA